MTTQTRLVPVETVHDKGSWLFAARDPQGKPEEIILVPCGDGVEVWVNRCTHEAQRLDRGFGAATRDGEIICPKHSSLFDACLDNCDNGDATGTRLVSVDVAVVDSATATSANERALRPTEERTKASGSPPLSTASTRSTMQTGRGQ